MDSSMLVGGKLIKGVVRITKNENILDNVSIYHGQCTLKTHEHIITLRLAPTLFTSSLLFLLLSPSSFSSISSYILGSLHYYISGSRGNGIKQDKYTQTFHLVSPKFK